MAEGPDMLAQAGALGDQLRTPVPRGLLEGRGPFRHVLLAGLGGSAAGARLAAGLLQERLRVPVAVTDAPALPGWVGPQSLVIVTSYSGATAEALDWWQRAAERGATRVAVTAGGPLADDAAATGAPLIRVPAGFEPRGALGLLFAPLVVLLDEAGVGARRRGGARARRRRSPTRVRDANGAGVADGGPSGAAADGLLGRAVVLYGAGALGAVAVRLKNQLNENAKAAAFAGGLPEVAHNEVLGWTGAMQAGIPLAAVLLRDPDETVAQRAVADGVADELRAEGHPVQEWTGAGPSAFERAFWLLAFGDHVSCRLGERLGVDLGEIDRLAPAQAAASGRACVPEPRRPDYH